MLSSESHRPLPNLLTSAIVIARYQKHIIIIKLGPSHQEQLPTKLREMRACKPDIRNVSRISRRTALVPHQAAGSSRPCSQTPSLLAKVGGSKLIYLPLRYLRRSPREGWPKPEGLGFSLLVSLQIVLPCLLPLHPPSRKVTKVLGGSSYTAGLTACKMIDSV